MASTAMVMGRSLTRRFLLDVDDLAAAIRAAVAAHAVRKLGGTALRAHRPGRRGDLAVRRTARVRPAPRRLALGDGHQGLLLVMFSCLRVRYWISSSDSAAHRGSGGSVAAEASVSVSEASETHGVAQCGASGSSSGTV